MQKKNLSITLVFLLLAGCQASDNPSVKIDDPKTSEMVLWSAVNGQIAESVKNRRGVIKEYEKSENTVTFLPSVGRSDGYLAFIIDKELTTKLLGESIVLRISGKTPKGPCEVLGQFHTISNGGTPYKEINFHDEWNEASLDLNIPTGSKPIDRGEIRIGINSSACEKLSLNKISLTQTIE